MELFNFKVIIASVLYAILGILILLLAYFFISNITHKNIWNEIAQNKNIALAIVLAALIIGISMIVSTAIHG